MNIEISSNSSMDNMNYERPWKKFYENALRQT